MSGVMKEITLQTVEFLEGGFYYYGDYTVIVSQRLGNRYNVVIQINDEVSTCCGLSCEQIKQVVGCIGGGFVEPVWTPQTRNDGNGHYYYEGEYQRVLYMRAYRRWQDKRCARGEVSVGTDLFEANTNIKYK